MTFNLANGAVNKTLVNQSIYSLAYSLDLGFGSFDPAFYSPVNWSQNDAAALAAANSASDTNGTVTISNSSNLHTYLYKQNPEDGSQNTTLSFDINTGVLQAFPQDMATIRSRHRYMFRRPQQYLDFPSD